MTWTVRPNLTSYDRYIFYSAIGEPIGVSYEPLAVAVQKNQNTGEGASGSQGTKFRFIAITKPSVYPPETFFSIVDIFSPNGVGNPYVTGIYSIRGE